MEANYDNDAFTNQQEWDYLALFYATHEDGNGIYEDWIYSDTLHPPFTGEDALDDFADWLACVPKTQVTVQIDGQGSVGGFDFAYGSHHPAADAQKLWVRDFATYAQSCTDACATNPTCDYNEITLTATPAEDWVFDYWWADITPDAGDVESPGFDAERAEMLHRNYNRSITIPMDDAKRVVAKFVHRPGLADMDLVNDLGEFLVVMGVNANASDAMNLQYDRGDFEVGADGETVFTGNGIPDAAEFALLETILKDIHLEPANGGAYHQTAWEDWERNLARAESDLPQMDAAVQRAVAAYMTLGSYGHRANVAEMANAYTQTASVRPADYANMAFPELQPGGDADNDGSTNLAEWNAAANDPNNATSAAKIGAFAANAVDSTANASEGEGEGEDCGCPTDACMTEAKVWLGDSDYAYAVVGITDPDDCDGPAVEDGEDVKLGRELAAAASLILPVRKFHWSAIDGRECGNAMIHGSDEISAKFMHTAATTVIPSSSTTWLFLGRVYGVTELKAEGDGIYEDSNPPMLYNPNEWKVYAGPTGNIATLSFTFEHGSWPWCPCCAGLGWMGNGGKGSLSYSTTIQVELGHTSTFLWPIIDNLPEHYTAYSANVVGGGVASVEGVIGSSVRGYNGSGPYVAFEVYMDADEDIGWQFSHWEREHDSWYLLTEHVRRFVEPFTAEATFRKRPELALLRKFQGGTGGSEACAGYVKATPAKKYYDIQESEYGHAAEVIQVKAKALPGYKFVHWQGEGKAWLNAEPGSSSGTWLRTLGASSRLDDPGHPVTSPTIYIKLVSEDEMLSQGKSITAVFHSTTWTYYKEYHQEGWGVAQWININFEKPCLSCGCDQVRLRQYVSSDEHGSNRHLDSGSEWYPGSTGGPCRAYMQDGPHAALGSVLASGDVSQYFETEAWCIKNGQPDHIMGVLRWHCTTYSVGPMGEDVFWTKIVVDSDAICTGGCD